MKDVIPLPAAFVFGASALVGGVSIGIAAVDHVRASKRGERMVAAPGLRGPLDYLILAGAIFATVLTLPSAYEQWSSAAKELSP